MQMHSMRSYSFVVFGDSGAAIGCTFSRVPLLLKKK
jgi:hypothetical protein